MKRIFILMCTLLALNVSVWSTSAIAQTSIQICDSYDTTFIPQDYAFSNINIVNYPFSPSLGISKDGNVNARGDWYSVCFIDNCDNCKYKQGSPNTIELLTPAGTSTLAFTATGTVTAGVTAKGDANTGAAPGGGVSFESNVQASGSISASATFTYPDAGPRTVRCNAHPKMKSGVRWRQVTCSIWHSLAGNVYKDNALIVNYTYSINSNAVPVTVRTMQVNRTYRKCG